MVATDTDNLSVTPRTPVLSTLAPTQIGSTVQGTLNNWVTGLTPSGEATNGVDTYSLDFS